MRDSTLWRTLILLLIVIPGFAFALNLQANLASGISSDTGNDVTQQTINNKQDVILRQHKSSEMKHAGANIKAPDTSQQKSHYRSPKCMFIKH